MRHCGGIMRQSFPDIPRSSAPRCVESPRLREGASATDPLFRGADAVVHLRISVCNLKRSLGFYTRVFGFHVVEDARHESEPRVVMRLAGGVYLALQESGDPGGTRPAGSGFLIEDLDRAREALWNLGVPVAGDGEVVDRAGRRARGRTFSIRDPDGHEIELMERSVPFWENGIERAPLTRAAQLLDEERGPK